MTTDFALDLVRTGLQAILLVTGPFLATAMTIGIAVGVVQAATQVQEQSLSFVPKLLAVGGGVVLGGPWILNVLVGYLREVLVAIATVSAGGS